MRPELVRRAGASASVVLLLVLTAASAACAQDQPRTPDSGQARGRRPGLWMPNDEGGPCPAEGPRAAPRPGANEPPGFQPFAHYDACAFPGRGRDLGMWATERRPMALMQDPEAPGSPPGVILTRYSRGLLAGRAPVYWNGWDEGGAAAEKQAFYLSMWIKIVGQDFEAAPAVTKLGFIGYGAEPHRAVNQGFFGIPSGRQATVGRAFQLAFFQQGHVDHETRQNVDRRPLMTAGTWHHWEAVLRLNRPGQANGELAFWIDGCKIIHSTTMRFVDREHPHGFTMYTWNPTWGGMGGTRTREDRILIDDVYLSGVPYRPDRD